MRDPLGRLWRVRADGHVRFVCYSKTDAGEKGHSELTEPIAPARKCPCGGDAWSLGTFFLCAKCAAEVRR